MNVELQADLPWLAAPREALRRRAAAGALPHALLIAGDAGLGGGALARDLVARLACVDADGPCGRCDGCLRQTAGQHPDHRVVTLEINEDTGKLRTEIVIGQVRALIGDLQLASHAGGWKSAIVDPADLLNHSAANALLKTLEEPPARTLLVLVTGRPDQLPATIRSRCQSIGVPRPDAATALAWLAEREPRTDWPLWLALAGGAPLAAQALAASPLAARRAAWAQALLSMPEGKGDPLRLAAEAVDQDASLFLGWWETLVRDLIVVRQADGDALRNPDLAAGLRGLAPRLHLSALHRFLNALQRARTTLADTNVTAALLVQSLLVAWAAGLAPEMMRAVLAED